MNITFTHVIMIIGFFLCILAVIYLIQKPKSEFIQLKSRSYKGVCLFDIDGTLTGQKLSGSDNAKLVQICLDAGMAVGINTAGPYIPQLWQNIRPASPDVKQKLFVWGSPILGVKSTFDSC